MTWSDLSAHIRHLSPADHERIRKAFDMGKKAHEGQTRKSGEPYFTHPIAVAGILGDMGADADTVIAALLHDTIEDTTIDPQVIEKEFGSVVLSLVDGVTKLSKDHMLNQPTLDEKIETLRKMFTLMQKDVRIMVIKLADRLHNVRTAQYLPREKQEKLAEETQEVYVKIAEQLSMQTMKDKLEESILLILYPEKFRQLEKMRKDNNKYTQSIQKNMVHDLTTHFPAFMKPVEVKSEAKGWHDLAAHLNMDVPVAESTDVTIVFVCLTIDSCYQMMGSLHQLWKREILSFHDLINAPLLNGYKAVHTTVILPSGERVHCKIRTGEMDKYALSGITTKCFEGKALGIAEYLPWTQRIGALAKDTKNRSDEFWESLKSDILGDSITVHGSDDGTAMVPKESTALDATFYLFGKISPRTTKIRVNGQAVPFDHPMQYADTLSIEIADKSQLTHAWLRYVKTGFALSQIRQALRTVSQEKKERFARDLLQQYMSQHHKGFLVEYDETKMTPRVTDLGYSSLNQAFAAVADGELDIISLYEALFISHSQERQRGQQDDYHISLRTPEETDRSFELLQYIQQVCKPISLSIRQSNDGTAGVVSMHIHVPRGEHMNMLRNLGFQGASSIKIESFGDRRLRYLLCILLMLLWGMDPVFASIILHSAGVTPVSFTILRLISVFLTATIIVGVYAIKYPLSHMPLRNISLWIAGFSFLGIALLTYISLQYSSPILYNTILRGNVLLVALAEIARRRGNTNWFFLSGILMIAGYAMIFFSEGLSLDLLLPFGVLGIFNLYTIASTRFQRDEKILARYPQFFFYMSGIALIGSLFLLPYSNLAHMSAQAGLGIAVYSSIFIGLPYFIFYWLTKRYGYAHVSYWIAPLLLITFAGQAIFENYWSVVPLIPAALLLLSGGMMCSRTLAIQETLSVAPRT